MTLQDIAQTIGYITTIIAFLIALAKVLKKLSAIAEGQKCLLRNTILDTYHKHCEEEEPTLREYERKNLDAAYAAYEGLHGNSFASDIYKEMRHWHVTR